MLNRPPEDSPERLLPWGEAPPRSAHGPWANGAQQLAAGMAEGGLWDTHGFGALEERNTCGWGGVFPAGLGRAALLTHSQSGCADPFPSLSAAPGGILEMFPPSPARICSLTSGDCSRWGKRPDPKPPLRTHIPAIPTPCIPGEPRSCCRSRGSPVLEDSSCVCLFAHTS